MASYEAIFSVSEAICNMLRQSRSAALYGPDIQDVECQVFTTANFGDNVGVDGEVAVFPYRVDISRSQRSLPPQPRYDGIRERHLLPLEVHYLLVPRARSAQLQQVILGWMMRVMEDTAILPANILNAGREGTFSNEEHIELIAESITTEEIMRIWDQLPSDFNISVPYCARLIQLESPLRDEEGPVVLRRDIEYRG